MVHTTEATVEKKKKNMPVAARQNPKTQTFSSTADTSRQVIIMDSLGARLETIPPDYVPKKGQSIHELVAPDEATHILHERAQDVPPKSLEGSGICKIQFADLPGHDVTEDALAYSLYPDPTGGSGTGKSEEWLWAFFAVYDGHYGFSTSRHLKNVLIKAVYKNLKSLYERHKSSVPTEEHVKATISKAFIKVDKDIISNLHHEADPDAVNIALQGSCALLSFYDAKNNRIFTACTGDSRAVVGKRIGSANIRWLAKPLSVDQSFASNPEEVRRVENEHPGENIVTQNRLMGDLAVSRAFGDARFKVASIPEDVGLQLQRIRSGPQYEMASSPYVTAEPVISVYSDIRRGDFLVLASDGLWDFLSSEDAVALVGRWTDNHLVDKTSAKRQGKTRLTQSQEETFVFDDDHASVHLIRNALGGVREGRLQFTLSLPPGVDAAKRHRDDITVMVVFFDPKT